MARIITGVYKKVSGKKDQVYIVKMHLKVKMVINKNTEVKEDETSMFIYTMDYER